MTVVYIDSLFLLNFVVNYLLLLAAAKLSGEPLRRLRMAGGAALGAAYAAAVFFPTWVFCSIRCASWGLPSSCWPPPLAGASGCCG